MLQQKTALLEVIRDEVKAIEQRSTSRDIKEQKLFKLNRSISPIKLIDSGIVCSALQKFYEVSDLYLPDDTTWPYWNHWPMSILSKVTKRLTKPL